MAAFQSFPGILVVDLKRGIPFALIRDPYGFAQLCGWSPTGDGVFYLDSTDGFTPDIWIVDSSSGRSRNLTNTPTRAEGCPHYWAAENLLIFGSKEAGDEEMYLSDGFPTVMTPNGGSYRVLSRNIANVLMDISPNGDSVAFLGGLVARTLSDIVQAKPWPDGRISSPDTSVDLPSWSPTSGQIAWSAMTWPEGKDVIALYDVATGETTQHHPYFADSGEGFLPAPTWSADGKWLAWRTYEGFDNPPQLWILSTETFEEFNLGSAHEFTWSPDSRSIATTWYDTNTGEAHSMLYRAPGWSGNTIAIPAGAAVASWFETSDIAQWSALFQPEEGATYTITQEGERLNVRQDGFINSPIVARLHAGDEIALLARFGEPSDGYQWWHILVVATGQEGWVVEDLRWYTPSAAP